MTAAEGVSLHSGPLFGRCFMRKGGGRGRVPRGTRPPRRISPEVRWTASQAVVWRGRGEGGHLEKEQVVRPQNMERAPGTHQAVKGPHRRPQRRLGRRLEEVAKAVGGGYCRLQMPLRLANAAGSRWIPGPPRPPPPFSPSDSQSPRPSCGCGTAVWHGGGLWGGGGGDAEHPGPHARVGGAPPPPLTRCAGCGACTAGTPPPSAPRGTAPAAGGPAGSVGELRGWGGAGGGVGKRPRPQPPPSLRQLCVRHVPHRWRLCHDHRRPVWGERGLRRDVMGRR